MNRPLLVGASRKSFIGRLTEAAVEDRLAGSLACACRAAEAGTAVLRVHDVKETIQALQIWTAIR
jgi:dihydropteroate synthase